MAESRIAARLGVPQDSELVPYLTKSGNRLLRAGRPWWAAVACALAHAGRFRVSGAGTIAWLTKADGRGAWPPGRDREVERQATRLLKSGVLSADGTTVVLTREGVLALEAALLVQGRRIDTEELLRRIDSREWRLLDAMKRTKEETA